jgi:dihydrofolate reductase
MLGEIKISFVVIVDNSNNMVTSLGNRIWHHQKLVNDLLKDKTCVFGRKTYDITQWKGPRSWVLTKNHNWGRSGIGTVSSIDDLRLFSEDDEIFVLGGRSLYKKLSKYTDTIYLYVINNNEGTEPWIDFNMREWNASEYFSNKIWSFAKLEKIKKEKARLLLDK